MGDALYRSQDKGMYRLGTLPVGPAARPVHTKMVGAAQRPARCHSPRTNVGTNYLAFYHFLEGLADYANWPQRIQVAKGKIKRMGDSKEIHHFTKRNQIVDSMAKLLSRFKDSMIVLSYQDGGIPSKDQILSMLENLGKKAKVFETPHRYVLSTEPKVELLFVAV